MSWNYRILAHETNNGNYFEIYEVYYDKNNKPNGYTSEPISVGGNDLKEVSDQLKRMATALEKPVLYAGEKFPQEFPEIKSGAPVDEDELWQEVVDLINDYDRDAIFSFPLLLVKSKFSITRKQ